MLPPGLPLCEAGVGRRGLACSAPEGEKHLRSPECSGPRQSPDAFPGQPGLWLGTQWALGERQSAARRAAQAPPLAAFSLGAPVRPPGGGGRAGLRQTRGVGRGRGRGRASSSPSVLSGEGHDAGRGVTDNMPSLPFSWLSPRASWLVTRSLTSEPLWVPGSRCPVRLVCRVSCPQVLSKRVWGPLRPQNTAVASASLC